jgi:hypothetical protein
MSPLLRRGVHALVGAVLVAGMSACSSSKSESVASTTSSLPATTQSTSPPTTDGPTPDICAAYQAMSQHDLRSVDERSRLANNWPALRAALAVDFAENHVLYANIALAASGTVRSDAELVAQFMPTSRALLLKSTSLAQYQAGLSSLPGDANVAQAAGRINDNAATTCDVQLVHPPKS